MNKNDLKFLKKYFKLEKTTLRINEMLSVYINGDNKDTLTEKIYHFNMMDENMKDIFIKNFKKILTGNLGVKLFEQNFRADVKENDDSTYTCLKEMIEADDTDDFVEYCNNLLNKIKVNYTYKHSIVVHFAKVNLLNNDNTYNFVICTINKVEQGKEQFIYNYNDKDFTSVNQLDPIVNMKSPIDGFMYPVYENEGVNTDKVLNYSSKSNKVNTSLVYNVLDCDIALSAKQEKEYFHAILQEITGGKVKAQVLHDVYQNISDRFENEENEEFRTLNLYTFEKVLSDVNMDYEKLEDAYKQTIANTKYEFKVDNILPAQNKKSINIVNEDAEIKIKPNCLNNVRQIQNDDGDVFLVVKLNDEDVRANGFNIDTEHADKL